jgi:hypothetical protein
LDEFSTFETSSSHFSGNFSTTGHSKAYLPTFLVID